MAIFIPLVTRFDPKGLQGAQRALANFQNFAVQVGRIAAAAVTAVGVASVREAAQFETTFAKIQGLVGLTASEIAELEDAAKRLGPQFGASGNEAGEALFFITSAGLRGAAAVNVLEASLKGAAIGLGDAKTIADLATSAVNAYGESNLSGAQAVDVLAEAVRLGKLEPAELAASMGDVLPLASALGVRFDEVGAAMAGMSKTGTDASTASTQLRGIFNTLVKPTGEAERALNDMGLSAQGLREQIREKGLFNTLETLTTAFDGNIEATATVFGNVRALTGVLDLMGPSLEDNRELFALMADDIGVLDEAFDIVSETSEFKFTKAMETARGSLLEIGSAILDNLQPHLDTFQGWIEKNGPAIEEGFIKIFDAVNRFVTSETLAKLATAFAEMWPDIEAVVGFLGDMAVALSPLLTGTISNSLPLLRDLSSIFGDIGRLASMITEQFMGMEFSGGELFDFFERRFGLMGRIRTAFEGIATAINAVVNAMQRAKDVGGSPFDALMKATFSPTQGFSFGGQRASGGPVSSSKSYLVGEMGPEIFTPSSGGGNITPNNMLGGSSVNITVNAGMGANGAQIGEQIVSAIRRYERTSGKVFASA
jgi:TP901 family phage tail tape measure protein